MNQNRGTAELGSVAFALRFRYESGTQGDAVAGVVDP